VRENFRRDLDRRLSCKNKVEMTSYRSRWPMSRKFEVRTGCWISKISRDLSGRIGEILEL
jgi:hypothetical protein